MTVHDYSGMMEVESKPKKLLSKGVKVMRWLLEENLETNERPARCVCVCDVTDRNEQHQYINHRLETAACYLANEVI